MDDRNDKRHAPAQPYAVRRSPFAVNLLPSSVVCRPPSMFVPRPTSDLPHAVTVVADFPPSPETASAMARRLTSRRRTRLCRAGCGKKPLPYQDRDPSSQASITVVGSPQDPVYNLLPHIEPGIHDSLDRYFYAIHVTCFVSPNYQPQSPY